MNIPRYWAKGFSGSGLAPGGRIGGREMDPISCWGWSDINLAQAEERGARRARAVAEMIRLGNRPDSYFYGERPMREEIIEEWKGPDETTYAAVTLNGYGCRVLNTASVMFVDVDLPEVSAWEMFKYKLKRLFGSTGPTPQQRLEADALARLEEMTVSDPRCGVRAYRTRAGLRYLFTHNHADPVAETTMSIMEALGSDPLYMRLCKVQECFRARLTPKPWRCGVSNLSVKYPWADAEAERQARDWVEAYSAKTQGYATCSFIRQLGSTNTDEMIARVVNFHDEITKAQSNLELA